MQVEEELARFAPQQETMLTIGVFDGVHLGHQHLIGYLKRQALARNLLSGVLTFRCHPQVVLSPETKLPYLTSLEERVRLVKQLGIELIVILSFTPELAQLSAPKFLGLLQKYLKMRGLVIGPDFALGRGREGNTSVLHTLGRRMSFTVDVVPPVVLEGEVVSSTRARKALAEGDMLKVRKLLGRTFSLEGEVVHGEKRGEFLGFPTANLAVDLVQALPPDGVYATRAYLSDYPCPSVTNIGRRPTFGEGERTVEVHLLNVDRKLYGQKLRIELVKWLREERRFSTPEELGTQIKQDVEQARAVLG
jgi:riboflavin kinase/FMN adenylyltransferase